MPEVARDHIQEQLEMVLRVIVQGCKTTTAGALHLGGTTEELQLALGLTRALQNERLIDYGFRYLIEARKPT